MLNINKKHMPIEMKSIKKKTRIFIITYLIVGCLWIILSDKLVNFLFTDPALIAALSSVKGLVYVIATSVLMFFLVYPSLKKLTDAYDVIKKGNAELERSIESYKSLYHKIEEKEALLKALINSIPDLIFYKNKNSVYLGCNTAFEQYVGKPENQIIGKSDFELFDAESAKHYKKMDTEMLKIGAANRNEETITYPDGKTVYLETLKTPYYDTGGNIVGLIGVSRDISGRKKKEEKIQYLNYHDILTGLYNRAFFHEESKRLDTARHLPLSVIMGDVNGLKLINDALGHAEGDKLLKEIADIFKECLRVSDIVARTGGDEFSILLPNTDNQTAQEIVTRIVTLCSERSHSRDKKTLYTNIALGAATKYRPEEPLEKIITNAEDFMYRRKLLEYKSFHSSILSSIKTTLLEKNHETEIHAERLAGMSRKFGEALELPVRIIDEIELVSTLHDIGKISLDVNILNKLDKLTDEEWHEIQKHPEVGFRIANAAPELRHLSEYILCHHERWDGKGYPQGLSGEDIPLISRIIALTDAFDAMTQDRPYRKALSVEMAVKEIEKNAGTQFDPKLAEVFIQKVLHNKTHLVI